MRVPTAAEVKRVLEAAEHVHGGFTTVLELANKLHTGREEFEAKHWGQSPKKQTARMQPLPDVRNGLVELGPLVAVTYRTKKGRDRGRIDYEHFFEGALPMLSFAPNGSGLVIVRDHSSYTVTNRGIEG